MKGKAALFTAAGSPMEIVEFPLPVVEPDAVLVKVALANICGSDLHIWRGEFAAGPMPTILGHEMTGTIYELGSNIKTDSAGQPLAVGDRVVYPYWKTCGRCRACTSGHTAACPNKYPFRTGRPATEPPHFVGAYGEYYYVVPGQHIFKVPDELSDEIVAPVNCALSQVLFGLSKVGVNLGDTVVIQGAGGLGLNAIAVAREMGAGQIIVIDALEERLKLAQTFGADHLVNIKEHGTAKERVGRIRELTSRRNADVVVEVAGVPEAITEGIGMLAIDGRYLIMGNISFGQSAAVDPLTMIIRHIKLVGVGFYEPWAIAKALDLLRRTKDKYPFHRILSHRFKLEEINEAFQQADQGNVIRATVLP